MPSVRTPRGKFSLLAVLALALVIWLLRDLPKSFNSPQPEGEWRTVVRIVDGDTFDLEDGERIRPIGVDAPEPRPPKGPEPCGREATAFAKQLLEGRRVRLEYDWERYDRMRPPRTLAYVFLEDGTFFNAEIIRQGYAHAYRNFEYRYKEDFLRYERQAHVENVGCLPEQAPNMRRE